MFQPFDLIFPWGTALVAIGLCAWGLVKSKSTVASLICALCIIAFVAPVAALYTMRYLSLRYDYQTIQGMKVVGGKVNTCTADEVIPWEAWTRTFWLKIYPEFCINEANKNAYLVCKDTETTESSLRRFVKGYAWNHTAVITYKPSEPKRTESLFIHEFSHLILFECMGSLDGDEHHTMFKKVGLGH